MPKCDFNNVALQHSMKLLCDFIEITLQHRCTPMNLLHIFRTPFPENTSVGLLLIIIFRNCALNYAKYIVT